MNLDNDRSTEQLAARVPADLDAPDKLAFDLTVRQIAVLTLAGLAALTVWVVLAQLLPMVPALARAVVLVPIAGVALALAAGRRDGLTLDTWLTAAALFRTRPNRWTTTPVHEPPSWAPSPSTAPALSASGGPAARRRLPRPGLDRPTPDRPGADRPGADRHRRDRPDPDSPTGLLRLPADGVDADGTIRYHDRGNQTATVLVACTTVNVALRTSAEQAALVAGLGRWLNGLTTDAQIVVATRRVDLTVHATRLAEHARQLAASTDPVDHEGPPGAPPHAGRTLAAAAFDHAGFLLDLAEACDPLTRTVTVATTGRGGTSPAVTAHRNAQHTAAALTALGTDAVILDGATATAVLTTSTDPYQPGDAAWPRTAPDAVVTATIPTAWTRAWPRMWGETGSGTRSETRYENRGGNRGGNWSGNRDETGDGR